MRLAFALATLLAPLPALAECPPVPERSERHTELMAEIAVAPDEATARDLSNQLWAIWTDAPDEIAQAILNRGMERRGSYDFLAAYNAFGRLIDYCPHWAEGYNQRAFISFLRGDYVASLEDLDRALRITPDHIGAASGRALALLNMGETREGQIALRYALALNPWLSERALLQPLEPETEETEL